ncbi:two-component system sensor histidine kinase NtrB [Dissulfurimicrobium hydrothermale]|uniref:two-component system sensor histidine kinase NtrB n=1 Tax=Dissulfurimicrobium hydrothermale TaxID=1750598 RepID=UPI001EDB1B60|nr:ATP-binding protein [Dissulfurimicrobium hydrothermale]UKL12871.1 PAS domain S-box protein [Dissulfurimicrobium hydrothermale]
MISGADSRLISMIFDSINGAIILVDEGGLISSANRRAIEMFSADDRDLVGLPFKALFMPEDRDILAENVINITRRDGEFETEAMLLKRDSGFFMGLVSTSMLETGEGKAVVVIVHDITKLKGLERLLSKSERMIFLGHMLDDISHQIRNPILTIGGFARRLAKIDMPKRDYVQVILEECMRLELLLSTLTEFIRLAKPDPRPIPVGSVIDELASIVKEAALENGLKHNVSMQEGLNGTEEILVDVAAFKKAVIAGLLNACESYYEKCRSDGSGVVDLEVRPSDQPPWTLMFVISDQGDGIRPSIMPHVFDPFFTTKTGHIGMGLTFAKRIQEEQGGHIEIRSEFGKGSSLYLYLLSERRRAVRTQLL